MLSSTKSRFAGKNLSQLFFAFLILQFTSPAQDGWFWQNPLPQGKSLDDFHIIDENNIVAFGMGVIVRTTDEGNNWNVKNIDMTIKSVSFIDDLTGWAGGYNSNDEGIVIKTTDGGENWVIKKYETYVNDVYFMDENIGWAVSGPLSADGNILRTTDGGESWTTQYTNSGSGLNSVFFINVDLGWAVGIDMILKTTNGGDIWTPLNFGTFRNLTSIYFVNNDTGWVVGEGVILKTTNGGNSWFEQTSGNFNLKSVYFVDANIGWAVATGLVLGGGFGGYIIKTTDGGNNWNTQLTSRPYGFTSVIPLDENIVWTVGTDGIILNTSDGGDNWIEISEGTRNTLNSVQFVDENTGWIVGQIAFGEGESKSNHSYSAIELFDSTIILKTTNGGDEWFPQFSSINESFNSAHFTDLNTGWAVGGYSGTGSGIIYNTTNGGEDWDEQFISSSHNNYTSVHFVDNNTGWVAGNGLILKTTNGGEDWLSYSTGTEHGFASIFFTDSLNGWAVGNIWNDDDFIIFNTTDGGETWVTQFISIYYLFDLFFIDSNNGWVVGYYNINPNQVGAVLKTTNGGDDWVVQEISSTHQFTSVYFTDLNNGWANGTELIRTTNGGDDWFIASSPTYSWGNNSVFFINETTGWIVGLGGAILKTTNGGVSFVEENTISEIPTDYSLTQNFPNPFNPSTRINYSIPQTSKVIIKVFDVLGNEIEILVNEEKQVGTYQVNWYAENLPSGVYFYRLRAGSFVETKKMVLMK